MPLTTAETAFAYGLSAAQDVRELSALVAQLTRCVAELERELVALRKFTNQDATIAE